MSTVVAPPGAYPPQEVDHAIAACQRIVEERRSARHPFVATLDQVRPGRPQLGRWAVQKYHQVFLQNVIFSNIHANAAEFEDVRQAMMDQLIAEETAVTSGSAPHYTLMRRFAEACGAQPGEFATSAAAQEVRAYVDALTSLCRHRHFALGMLVIYCIESQSGESAGKLLAWLRANHGFSEEELEWFAVHAEDEDDHAAAGLALVRRHAPLVPDFHAAAIECSSSITDAWLRLHDFYLSLLGAAQS
jgi:pyrroloquinoline-quinone synthase